MSKHQKLVLRAGFCATVSGEIGHHLSLVYFFYLFLCQSNISTVFCYSAMSSRRRPPADLAAVKRSRAGCTGAITKALDRFKAIPSTSSEEVILINSKEIDRILTSIIKTETAFLLSLEDAQTFVPEDSEEAFQQEEELAADNFTAAITATRDLGEQLLCLKAVLNGLANFTCDLDAIQDTLASKPDSNQVSALQALETLFTSLRSQWQTANLPKDHPIKTELDSCRRVLATLGADVTAASDRSDSHSTSSTTTSSATGPCYIMGRNDLPTIDVPKFTGDILDWSSFWSAFKSTIEDRKELSDTQRLHYLRQAINDPELQLLLHSPAESPDFYAEVVSELKERFAKTREIHKLLSRTLADLTIVLSSLGLTSEGWWTWSRGPSAPLRLQSNMIWTASCPLLFSLYSLPGSKRPGLKLQRRRRGCHPLGNSSPT